MESKELTVPIGTVKNGTTKVGFKLHDGRRAASGVIAGDDTVTNAAIVEQVVRGAAEAGWGVHYIALKGQAPSVVDDVGASFDAGPRPEDFIVEYEVLVSHEGGRPILVVIDTSPELFLKDAERWNQVVRRAGLADVAFLVVTPDLDAGNFGGSAALRSALVAGTVIHTRSARRDALDHAIIAMGARLRALEPGGREAYIMDNQFGAVLFEIAVPS